MSAVTVPLSRKEVKELTLQISKAQNHLEDLKNTLLKRNVDEQLIQQIFIAIHHSSHDVVIKTSQTIQLAKKESE